MVDRPARGSQFRDRLRGQLKIGAALVLTSTFIPLLFQGEEWAASSPFLYFTDHQDPTLATAVVEGRCREFQKFGWDPLEISNPQSISTFERSKLDWSELRRTPHDELLEWHRNLIRLRAQTPVLQDGCFDYVRNRYDERERWLTVKRGPVMVAFHRVPAVSWIKAY